MNRVRSFRLLLTAILATAIVLIYLSLQCASNGDDWVLVRQLKGDINGDGVAELLELKVIGLFEKDGKLAYEDDHQTWKLIIKDEEEREIFHIDTRGCYDAYIAEEQPGRGNIIVMIYDSDVANTIYTFVYEEESDTYRENIVASFDKTPDSITGTGEIFDYRWYPQEIYKAWSNASR